MLEYPLDTDTLGTFSGEVERQGSMLETARRKCQWGMEMLGPKVEYGLASEGSFGPHPYFPFMPCDQEILYFIDRRRGFHLHVSHLTEQTNYSMKAVATLEELKAFAKAAKFPSHALILRPNDRKNKIIFKGLDDETALIDAFEELKSLSQDGLVWVETDMRAQFNPSRMDALRVLAGKMAERLATLCPSCQAPGWGVVATETGLPCEYCAQKTEMLAAEVYGCTLCTRREIVKRQPPSAPQKYCSFCNP